MKTYTKQITETKPRLLIEPDLYPQSPRYWSNLGYFITIDRNYSSPDNNPELTDIIETTGQQAISQAEHIELIKKSDYTEKIIAVYPIVKHEHSAVSYSLGSANGFDYSNNGFYIITDKTQKEIGTPKSRFEKVIKQELQEYSQYANGKVYSFILYDKNGEQIDSCTGFYNIDEIKSNLPKEWEKENMQDYYKN
jgi:hypothetical protein